MRPVFSKVIYAMWIITFTVMPVCTRDSVTENTSDPFTIHNLGVAFVPYNASTGLAGDFLFVRNRRKVFLEFGAVISDGQGGTKALPTFEYLLRKDAWITAIADGEVVRFAYQEDTQDYEFGVQSTQNENYDVGYDHVLNPRVGPGDLIHAGDTLGNPGTWDSQLGRFEIMINNNASGYSCCPFCVFDPAVSAMYEQQVLDLIRDWEAFKGDQTIYDEESHTRYGCTMDSMITY